MRLVALRCLSMLSSLTYASSTPIVKHVCDALVTLMQEVDRSAAIASAGGAAALTTVLTRHADDTSITTAACEVVLEVLATEGSTASVSTTSSLAAVAEALAQNAGRQQFAWNVGLALCCVVERKGGHGAVSSMDAIAPPGHGVAAVAAACITPVVTMLGSHMDQSGVERSMTKVLCFCAAFDDLHAAIVAAGGIGVLVAALPFASPYQGPVSAACALFRLARCPDAVTRITVVGGAEALVMQLRRFAMEAVTVTQVAGALRRLASNADALTLMTTAGACRSVVQAMTGCAHRAAAVKQCCLLLDTLASVEAQRAAIAAAGGVAALEAAIARHGDDAAVVEAARSALGRLSS